MGLTKTNLSVNGRKRGVIGHHSVGEENPRGQRSFPMTATSLQAAKSPRGDYSDRAVTV